MSLVKSCWTTLDPTSHKSNPTNLFQGVNEALQSCKVADELEDSEYPHDPDESHDLAGLAEDVEILHGLDERRQDVGKDGEKVDEIHGLKEMRVTP